MSLVYEKHQLKTHDLTLIYEIYQYFKIDL